MTIKLAFQKKLGKNASLAEHIAAKGIQWYTKSEYFHVEVIIDNKWISSGPSYGGVYIHDLEPLDEYTYEYIEIDIDGRKSRNVMRFIERQIGTKYDWAGIVLSQFFHTNADDKNKWFCSELVAEILKLYGELPEESKTNSYSPEDIYQAFK